MKTVWVRLRWLKFGGVWHCYEACESEGKYFINGAPSAPFNLDERMKAAQAVSHDGWDLIRDGEDVTFIEEKNT